MSSFIPVKVPIFWLNSEMCKVHVYKSKKQKRKEKWILISKSCVLVFIMSHCQQAHSFTGCWPTYPSRNLKIGCSRYVRGWFGSNRWNASLLLDHRLLQNLLLVLYTVHEQHFKNTMNQQPINDMNQMNETFKILNIIICFIVCWPG